MTAQDPDEAIAANLIENAVGGDKDTITRLAAMSPLEYDRLREIYAKKLGIRVRTLDAEVKRLRGEAAQGETAASGLDLKDPEPWPNAVNGAELLDRLTAAIRRHMVLPSGAAEAVALWIIHSHAHDTAAISPILAVTSPTPECGKTTLLTLLLALSRRPVPAANITAAAVFRAVEKWSPTLVIDEADTFLRDSDELRGVLNSGHNRITAYVVRNVGEDHEPKLFRTWSPKAFALIGKLPATLESRAIHVELRRIAEGETVTPLRGDRLNHLEPLRRQCWRWALDNDETLRSAEPDIPETVRGRSADNWRHLLAIADRIGGDWPAKARQAAATLSVREGKTAAVMLLEDIRRLFLEKGTDRLTSAEMVAELAKMEGQPWPEWHNCKAISTTQLAKLLKPFGIVPGTIRTATATAKGYHSDAFADAFRRYPPPQAVTTSQPLEIKASRPEVSCHISDVVTAPKALNPLGAKACDGVAAPEPYLGERDSEERLSVDEIDAFIRGTP